MALTRPRYSTIIDTDWKTSVRAATVGSNITLAGGAPNTLDGVTLVLNDRILVKDQSLGKENGIYRVATLGTGSNGTWVRAYDANADISVTSGQVVPVTEGTQNGGHIFLLSTSDPITVGSTSLTYVSAGFNSAGINAITNSNVSTSTTTGALTVAGGVGIGGNIYVGGNENIAGNSNVGNLGTTGSITASNTVTGGNLSTGGTLNVTGNANVGNLGTTGSITASSTVTGGNLSTGGNLNVTGNANVGNLGTSGSVIASTLTSNVATGTAPLTVTSTTYVANLNVATAGNLVNGNSNVIVTANGNITMGSAGNAAILTVTGTGANISGTANISGNANTGNLGTGTIIATTANLTTINSGLVQNGTSNVTINSSGNVNISVSGNVLTVTSTGANVAGTANVSGNANVGNLGTGGLIVATGNVTGGNLNTAANVLAGNVNVNSQVYVSGTTDSSGLGTGVLNVAGGASISKNLYVGGNLYVANLVSTSNITLSITNPLVYLNSSTTYPYSYDIGFYSHFSLTGPPPGNGYQHTGFVRDYSSNTWLLFSNVAEPSAGIFTFDSNTLYDAIKVGNITGTGTANINGNANVGNLGTAGLVVATGNVTGGNLVTGGVLSVTGNANTGNLGTGTVIATTANLTTINSGLLQNGTSNLSIVNNGNIAVSVGGTTNVVVWTTTGLVAANANVSGYANIVGNANAGNIGTGGILSVTGNANVGNLGTAGLIVATGNVTGGNLVTGGALSVTGNANVGNIGTGSVIATSNIVAGSGGGSPNYYNIASFGRAITAIAAANSAVLEAVGTAGNGGAISLGNATSRQALIQSDSTNNLTFWTSYAGLGNAVSLAMTIDNTGAVTMANALSVTANISGGNISTGGTLSVTGNANVGNLGAGSGTITTLGNVLAGNANVTANANVGNLNYTGNLYQGGNLRYAVRYTASTAPHSSPTLGDWWYDTGSDKVYLRITDGTTPSWLDTTSKPPSLVAGTSNVVVTSNGNVVMGVAGNAQIFTVTGTGANVSGTLNVTANLSGGNLITAGYVSATGNITSTAGKFIGDGGLLTNISASGGTSIVNGNSNVVVVANSNVSISAIGNANVLVVTGVGANISGTLGVTGNITGNYILGNGSQLTGIITTVSNVINGTSNINIASSGSNVTVGVAGNANVLVVSGTGANITGTANVSGNANVGNLGAATVIATTGANVGNLITTGANGTVQANNITTTGAATGNVNVATITGNLGHRALFTTYTDNSAAASATIANAAIHAFDAPNIAAANASVTLTNAATFYVAGAPVANTNVTITNPYSILVGAGNVNIAGTGAASSSTTGVLRVGGGAGIAGNIYVGTNANVSGTANITGNILAGANIVYTGNLYQGSQLRYALAYTASTAAPSGSTVGDYWYDTATDILYLRVSDGVTPLWFDVSSQANTFSDTTTTNATITTASITTANISGNINAANLQNGNSNVRIVANGNVTVSATGTANVVLVTSTGANITGTLGVTGNATVGNLTVSGSTTIGSNVGGYLTPKYGITFARRDTNADMYIMYSAAGLLTWYDNIGAADRMYLSAAGNLYPAGNGTQQLGLTTNRWSNIWGLASSAQYADLAERYASDDDYSPGTVVIFGGNAEITVTTADHDPRIAGVISTNPGYLMNDNADQDALMLPVALTGRVPTRVRGPIRKGDMVVSSTEEGVAIRMQKELYEPGCVIGKSLENIADDSIQTIEVVVGRL